MSEPTPPTSGAPDPQAEPNTPATLTLTEDDLAAKIDAALKAERDSAAKVKADADADAKRKADEEQGKWKDIAEKAERERDEAKADLLTRDRHDAIRAAVNAAAKDKEGYPAELFDRYVAGPLIVSTAADTKPEAITKAAKEAIEQYVTDNPRQAKGGIGVPPAARGRTSPTRQPIQRPSTAGVASSRF